MGHGKKGTRAYNSWINMKQRCYNKNRPDYKFYGARGIKVCRRWLDSFENFYEDMGEPEKGTSLDRINVDGDYCLENCRWLDQSGQCYNKRKSDKNKSGKTGVIFNKLEQKWKAFISYKNKIINLGTFNEFNQALKARHDAELKYYGKIKE